jgi:peptidoglycan/LPS O-acetylase OafA/YrhL
VIALPLLLWGRGERGGRVMARVCRWIAHPLVWLAVAFTILIGEALPDLAGKNLFYYLVFFVLGYLAMCGPEFMDAAERFAWPSLLLGAFLCAWWVATGPLRDSLPDPSLPLTGLVIAGMLGRWMVIVGLLGVGRRHLDTPSPQLAYLAEGSYPVYILHQTVIVVLAFYVVQLQWAWFAQWLLLLALATAGTFALYEGVRRAGPLRFLFGMRPARRDAASRA